MYLLLRLELLLLAFLLHCHGVAGTHGIVGAWPVGFQLVGADFAEADGVVAAEAVAYILLTATDSAKQPANTAAEGLDDVPDIHGVKDGREADQAARLGLALVFNRGAAALVEVRARVVYGGRVLFVWRVGESPEVQQRKGSHFYAEEQRGDADFDVWVGEDLVGVHNVEGRGADGNGRGLPEGEEDDELDGDDFDEKFVLGDGFAELNVHLDKTEHGNCDGNGVDDDNLQNELVRYTKS